MNCQLLVTLFIKKCSNAVCNFVYPHEVFLFECNCYVHMFVSLFVFYCRQEFSFCLCCAVMIEKHLDDLEISIEFSQFRSFIYPSVSYWCHLYIHTFKVRKFNKRKYKPMSPITEPKQTKTTERKKIKNELVFEPAQGKKLSSNYKEI